MAVQTNLATAAILLLLALPLTACADSADAPSPSLTPVGSASDAILPLTDPDVVIDYFMIMIHGTNEPNFRRSSVEAELLPRRDAHDRIQASGADQLTGTRAGSFSESLWLVVVSGRYETGAALQSSGVLTPPLSPGTMYGLVDPESGFVESVYFLRD